MVAVDLPPASARATRAAVGIERMIVRRVTLTNVRAHAHLLVDLRPGLNVLVGPNGAGKTTILEALALVLQGGMLRPGSVRDLIKQDEEFLRVEVVLAEITGREIHAAGAYTRGGDRRLTADGADLPDSSRWRESAQVRTFIPDDLRLIKGSPRRRRDYLDTLAGAQDPAYRDTLRQYEEALAQRNSLLRSRYLDLEDHQFAPWEKILAETGTVISTKRAARLQNFIGTFQQTYAQLTGEPGESIRLVYRSNANGLDIVEYETRLREMRGADRQRTFTHLGPHRDDLRLMRRGLDMRDCASQGEQRAALLTMVLAEWEESGRGSGAVGEPDRFLPQAAGDLPAPSASEPVTTPGRRPLLLLDDVMSELDEEKRRALVAVVRRGGQTIVTATDLRYFTSEELTAAHLVDLPARA